VIAPADLIAVEVLTLPTDKLRGYLAALNAVPLTSAVARTFRAAVVRELLSRTRRPV